MKSKKQLQELRQMQGVVNKVSSLQSSFDIIFELAAHNKNQLERLKKKLSTIGSICETLSRSQLHSAIVKDAYFKVQVFPG